MVDTKETILKKSSKIRRPGKRHGTSNRALSQYEKFRALESYSRSLQREDANSIQYFQEIIKQIRHSYLLNNWLYVTTYILAVSSIGFGLYLLIANQAIQNSQTIGVLILAAGTITIITLSRRDPAKNIRILINNLAKLNITYLGYIRQIQQADIVFIDMVMGSTKFGPKEAENALKQVQDIVDQALDGINQILEEMDY